MPMPTSPNTAWSPYPIGRIAPVPSDAWVAWWEAYRAYHYANLRAFRALLGLGAP